MKLTRYLKDGKPADVSKETIKVKETAKDRYARTHPEQHRGVSGCCDSALNYQDVDTES